MLDLQQKREDLKDAGYTFFEEDEVCLDGWYTISDLETVLELMKAGWVDG